MFFFDKKRSVSLKIKKFSLAEGTKREVKTPHPIVHKTYTTLTAKAALYREEHTNEPSRRMRSSSSSEKGGPKLHAFTYVTAFVLLFWLPFVKVHYDLYHDVNEKRINFTHALLTLFNAVNVLICVWEMSLFVNQNEVQKTYRKLKKEVEKRRGGGGGDLPTPLCLFEKITLREALSLKHWHVIWSTYALLDPSYVQTQSWGFWVDTGNGFVTIAPTIAMTVGATYDLSRFGVSPLAYGLIGLIFNYQMMYGTVIYFSNYAYQRYYERASFGSKIVVLFANVIWIVFPMWWMKVCFEIVKDGGSFRGTSLR